MRLFKNRKLIGLDKQRWVLWRWIDIWKDGEIYLTRLVMFRCPLFSVMLHWINKEDGDGTLHDHPWAFFCFIVKGSYVEVRANPTENELRNVKYKKITFFNAKDTKSVHEILSVSEGGAISLVFTGPKRKSWSFFTPLTRTVKEGEPVPMIRTPWRNHPRSIPQ